MVCPDENTFARLCEGRLAPAERTELEAHLDGCLACTLLLRELGGVLAKAPAAAPPPGLATAETVVGAGSARAVGGDAGGDRDEIDGADGVADAARELDETSFELPGRYRIVNRLGAGGMGVVYAAEDRNLGRTVALKLVRTDWLSPDQAVVHRSRLLREARLLAGLSHPNVMTVFDAGTAGDRVYITMALVAGRTARRWRDDQQPAAAEVLAVYRAAGAGLAAVHRAGVVHRDVKPDNILVGDDGRVYLTDFGLATVDDGVAADGRVLTTLTSSGQFLGTPAYMAAEQLRGEPVDARADQFGFCASLWEALYGERPYAGDTVAALAVAMTRPPARPARRAGIADDVARVLARGLAADREARWPSMDALLAALERATARPRAARRRALVWAGAAVAAAAAGAAAVIFAAPSLRSHAARAIPAPAPVVAALAPRVPPPDIPASASVSASASASATPPAAIVAAPEHLRRAPVKPRPPVEAAAARPAAAPPPASPPTALPPSFSSAERKFKRALEEATRRLTEKDPRGCLALLDAAAPFRPPFDPGGAAAPRGADSDDPDFLRSLCVMAAGDCDGGASLLRDAFKRRHRADDRRSPEQIVAAMRSLYCTGGQR